MPGWKVEPYTVNRSGWIPFYNRIYSVMFEETRVFIANDRRQAVEIAAIANAAYNLGFAQGSGHVAGYDPVEQKLEIAA